MESGEETNILKNGERKETECLKHRWFVSYSINLIKLYWIASHLSGCHKIELANSWYLGFMILLVKTCCFSSSSITCSRQVDFTISAIASARSFIEPPFLQFIGYPFQLTWLTFVILDKLILLSSINWFSFKMKYRTALSHHLRPLCNPKLIVQSTFQAGYGFFKKQRCILE